MKKTGLKHMLAVLCIMALLVGILPAYALAMDFSAYQQAIAEYQAALDALIQAQGVAQQEPVQYDPEDQDFDVEEAYWRLVLCEDGEEREEYFLSLNEDQRELLVEYLEKLAYYGYFEGFDDFEIPGFDELTEYNGESVEEPSLEAMAEDVAEEPSLEAMAEDVAEEPSPEAMAEDVAEEPSPEALTEDVAEEPGAESFGNDLPIAPTEDDEPGEENVIISGEIFLPGIIDADDTADVEETEDAVQAQNEESSQPVDDTELPEGPSEEDMFYSDYEHYINLYKEFGQYADLSGVSFEVQERIKALVDAPEQELAAEEVAEDAADADGTDGIDETGTADDTDETEDGADADGTDSIDETEDADDTDDAEAANDTSETDAADGTDDTEDAAAADGTDGVDETKTADDTDDAEAADDTNETDDTDDTNNVGEAGDNESEDLDEEAPAPSADPATQAPEPKSVDILSSLEDNVTLGAPITLTGVLEDAEDFTDVVYVWEVDKGNGYEPVPDADGAVYTFPATTESLSWNWRLSVYYR